MVLLSIALNVFQTTISAFVSHFVFVIVVQTIFALLVFDPMNCQIFSVLFSW